MQRTRTTNIDKSFILLGFVSGGIVCVADIILSLVLALCLNREYIGIDRVALLAPFLQFLATLIGMLIAGKFMKERVVVICALTGVFSFVIRLCTAMLFFDGVSMATTLGMIMTIGVSFLTTYLLLRGKRSGDNRRKKGRYR